MTRALCAFALACACMHAGATTYYVSDAIGNDASNGQSWAEAKKTIQAAVNVAFIGDTVLVTNGVYRTGGKPSPYAAVPLSNRVMIATYDILVASVNGPEVTIIEGLGPVGTNAVRCAYLGAGTLAGFTLSNGATFASYAEDTSTGGGVLGNAGSGKGIVSNCIITCNTAFTDGSPGSPMCSGGGASRAFLYRCVIKGNTTPYNGGGVSRSHLYSCVLDGNTAAMRGGGAYLSTLHSCVLQRNTAQVGGGAAGYWAYDEPNKCELYNCTVAGNGAKEDGGGTANCTVYNSIVYFNTNGSADATASNYYNTSIQGVFTNSCTAPLPVTGTNNTDANPLVLNHGQGDYRLSIVSPCVSRGANGLVVWPRDVIWRPRINGDSVDMGAYETYVSPTDSFGAASAMAVGSNVYSFSDNRLATTEPGEPAIAGCGPFHTLWWTWSNAGTAGKGAGDWVQMDTFGSSFDTVLGVFTGTAVNALGEVVSNDDAYPGTNASRVVFAYDTGVVYHVVVGGHASSDVGDVALAVALVPEPAAAALLAVGCWLFVKIDRRVGQV